MVIGYFSAPLTLLKTKSPDSRAKPLVISVKKYNFLKKEVAQYQFSVKA